MSCGIYKITNSINGKSYIGQSIDIETRWKKHLRANDNFAIHQALKKYGQDSFIFEIIEECPLDSSILDEREQYWIAYFNSYQDGYNMTPGGSNHIGSLKGKKVKQYSLDGAFLALYDSAHEANRQTGVNFSAICRCCRGERNCAGDYIWRYEDSDILVKPINKKNTQRTIYQFDKDGKFIEEYSSLAEASNITQIGKTNISQVLSGKAHTAGGYQWSYDKICSPVQTNYHGKIKPILQIDPASKTIIAEYSSLTEASQITGINRGNIGSACQEKRKTAGGYIWKYKH